MFRTRITSDMSPFMSQSINNCCRISGDNFREDVSFVSTLRALLMSRVENTEPVRVIQRMLSSSEILKDTEFDDVVDCDLVMNRVNYNTMDYSFGDEELSIVVINVVGDKENNEKFFDALERYNSKKELKKVREFYRKAFNVACFVEENPHYIRIFVDRLDLRKWHFIQLAIPVFLPWLFEGEKELSESDLALIYSLKENTEAPYLEALRNIFEQTDFRTMLIRQQLDGIERRYQRAEYDKTVSEIERLESTIQDMSARMGSIRKEKLEKQIRLMGLDVMLHSEVEESELVNYFICNKKLYLQSVTGDLIRFCVGDYITYFDSEMAETTLDNPNSVAYRGAPTDEAAQAMRKLMKDVFCSDEPSVKIATCAAYELGLRSNVMGLRNYSFPAELISYIPNLHIQEYSCLGNYEMAINTLMDKGDYIGAIEQCVGSCKSLNWGDITVMEAFFSRIWSDYDRTDIRSKYFELPDGSKVGAKEAIEFIERKDADE